MKTKRTNRLQKEVLKFLAVSAVWMGTLAFTQVSFAQNVNGAVAINDEGSGHSGGGNITEADLRYYMGKMDTYLLSAEGQAAFPEIVAFDQAHPTEKFHDLLLNTKPVVQKGELRDSNGVVRDCMSYANPSARYFVCNSDALPNKTLENQPSFYRIVLHELFVQAEIEKPVSKDVPSVYSISSRITDNVHLETYQEWVPGKNASGLLPGIQCEFVSKNGLLKKERGIILQASEYGARLLITEIDNQVEKGSTDFSNFFRRITTKKDHQVRQDFYGVTQLGYLLTTNSKNDENKLIFNLDKKSRNGVFKIKTENGYELELSVRTRSEDINGGMTVYIQKNGRELKNVSDVGSCSQVTFSSGGFNVYTNSVRYGTGGSGYDKQEELLEKSIRWLKNIK